MKPKSFKITGLAAALAAFGLVFSVGIHGQQSTNESNPPLMTTNWFGNLVVGEEDTADRIARGPQPTTISQVQIGLRSDGVVIWRTTPGGK